MKRSGYFVLLLALGSFAPSAHAAGFSFTFHGQHIRIEAPRHCRSTSCVSVSIPGMLGKHRGFDDDGDAAAPSAPAVTAPMTAPAPAAPQPALPAVSKPAPAIVAAAPPAPISTAPVTTASVTTASVTPANITVLPAPAPTVGVASSTTRPVAAPPPVTPAVPAVAAVPRIASISTKPVEKPVEPRASEPVADSPIGDWQTEGRNGMVRIEACGSALCGHMLDPASNAKGETVLVNMKPKNDTQWTGTIISRASGESYYAIITMTRPDLAKVEACAVGRFFCTGKEWTRLEKPREAMRQLRAEAR